MVAGMTTQENDRGQQRPRRTAPLLLVAATALVAALGATAVVTSVGRATPAAQAAPVSPAAQASEAAAAEAERVRLAENRRNAPRIAKQREAAKAAAAAELARQEADRAAAADQQGAAISWAHGDAVHRAAFVTAARGSSGRGWRIDDDAFLIHRGEQVCAMLRNGASANELIDSLLAAQFPLPSSDIYQLVEAAQQHLCVPF
jgi:ATPase subunit of ABC transporter with duplicated ATPase domains